MRRKILAIDDSHTLRQFIVTSLTHFSADYEILTAANGGEGLSMSDAQQPDLILVDYMLPDMKGPDLCRALRDLPRTAPIPVLFMSSNAVEIQKIESECRNVKSSIAKPFTPELLCAAVSRIFKEMPSSPKADYPAENLNLTPGLAMSGSADYFPLIAALRGIEKESLTGVLRVYVDGHAVELIATQGLPLLVTSRDANWYLLCGRHEFTKQQQAVMEDLKRVQITTGAPVFMSLAERGLIEPQMAAERSVAYGWRLFATAWPRPALRFEFENLKVLPSYTKHARPPRGTMDEWAMNSLRQVGGVDLTPELGRELDGIPAYTRAGYAAVQEIELTPEELNFATLVSNGGMSLEEIAQKMSIPMTTARLILFRFARMQIFECWPTTLLQG